METASISKLKASLSHYLCIVRTGEEVLVTDRGKAVAKLVPVSQEGPGLATSPEGIGKGRSDPDSDLARSLLLSGATQGRPIPKDAPSKPSSTNGQNRDDLLGCLRSPPTLCARGPIATRAGLVAWRPSDGGMVGDSGRVLLCLSPPTTGRSS